jgi:hypothetical protein
MKLISISHLPCPLLITSLVSGLKKKPQLSKPLELPEFIPSSALFVKDFLAKKVSKKRARNKSLVFCTPRGETLWRQGHSLWQG